MNSVIAMSYESGSNQRLRPKRNDTINVSGITQTLEEICEFRNVTRDRQRPDSDLLAALRYRNVKDIRGYLGGQSGGSAFNTIVNPRTQQRYSIQSKQGQRLLKSYVKSLNTRRGGASSLDRNCEISQEPLRNGERVCKTSTGQYYHWDSLSGWLQHHNTCPTTRQP